jgi:hypothetical protein
MSARSAMKFEWFVIQTSGESPNPRESRTRRQGPPRVDCSSRPFKSHHGWRFRRGE